MGKKRSTVVSNGKGKSRSALKKVVEYFKEVWAELYKITWPSYEEVKQGTVVVFFVVIVVSAFLAIVDVVVSRIFKLFVF